MTPNPARSLPAALCALAMVATASAGSLQATYAKSFTVTFSGYAGSTPLTNFPVLVRLSPSINGFMYSACRQPAGEYHRFTDASGNLLASEIDTWNVDGESCVWVKVPELTRNTVITAHYGCASPDAIIPSDVWSEGYVGVWHLGGDAQSLAESSGRSNPFAAAGTTPPATSIAGRVGGAVDFTGASANGRFESADADALDGFTNLTIEAWTKQPAYRSDNNAFLLSKRNASNNEVSYFVYMNSAAANLGKGIFCISTSGTSYDTPIGSGIGMLPALDAWCHQVYVRDAANKKVYGYMDGSCKNPNGQTISNTNELYASSAPLVLGNSQTSGYNAFNGLIDEVRISNVARNADWIQASHDTVSKADFATYGSDAPETLEGYSRKFTVTFGWDGEALPDFPALVRLSEFDETAGTGIQGFHYADFALENGGDLRFVDSAGNPVPHEIDTWNTNGESTVWVKVPSLGANTRLTACYGNSLPPTVSGSVWDEHYVGVWHLGNSSLPLAESSGKANGFTSGPGNPALAATGAVGGAVDFSSAASYARFEAASAASLSGFPDLTIEAWTKQSAYPTANAFLLSHRNTSSSEIAYFVYMYGASGSNNGKGILGVSTSGTSSVNIVGSGAGMLPPLDEWCHQAYVRDATGSLSATGVAKAYPYLNGVPKTASGALADTTALHASSAPLVLGNSQSNGNNAFNGLIDEVRISNVARSAAWVKASHDTVADASFTTCSAVRKIVRGMVVFFR